MPLETDKTKKPLKKAKDVKAKKSKVALPGKPPYRIKRHRKRPGEPMVRITYEDVADAFLSKITEFEFLNIPLDNRQEIIDGYMKRAAAAFRKNCKYDLTHYDDLLREFDVDIKKNDIDELLEILSEGMVVQWMKPYLYRQEVLELTLNTKDFTTYSPAELLYRINEAYQRVEKDYIQMIREYSYNHGDLGRLHL